MSRGNPGNEIGGTLAWMARQQADDARRNRNRQRSGRVVETDYENGLYRVDLTAEGSQDQFIGPWMPLREVAMGAMKTHMPLSVGQEVKVHSESGDLQDGEIVASLPSEDNPRPSQSGDEYILADYAGTRITVTGGGLIVTTGGSITMVADVIDLNPEG